MSTTNKFLKLIKWPLYFIGVFLLAIALRVFVFEIYNIPSGSMKQTLLPGDKVVVNKLLYGPKLPNNLGEIPWLNIFSSKQNKYSSGNYKRLQGFSGIRHNDIVVFDHPSSPDIYIKRCAGLAGDQLRLYQENTYINGQKIKNPPTIKHEYRLYSSRAENIEKWAKKNNAHFRFLADTFLVANLSLQNKRKLNKSSLVDSARFLTEKMKNNHYASLYKKESFIFNNTRGAGFLTGKNNQRKWKYFDFGPVYVPAKGDKIRLDTNNIHLYRKIITRYEGHQLERKGENIFIDGHKQNNYEFEQNYYFVLGDNRISSSDSRSWGFVPEDHIIGKATRIIFSTAKGKKKWKRIFKRIE
jgi:signal peptidase I